VGGKIRNFVSPAVWFPEGPWNQRLCGVAFDDHSDGQHDNVLIDIFCDKMHQAQLPARIVRVMLNLLWHKDMVFYYENQPVAECVGFRGIPQGSALTPFSYYFYYTSQADRVLPVRYSMLQYADVLGFYASHVGKCPAH
jgi:hypothetical protein